LLIKVTGSHDIQSTTDCRGYERFLACFGARRLLRIIYFSSTPRTHYSPPAHAFPFFPVSTIYGTVVALVALPRFSLFPKALNHVIFAIPDTLLYRTKSGFLPSGVARYAHCPRWYKSLSSHWYAASDTGVIYTGCSRDGAPGYLATYVLIAGIGNT